MLPLRPINAMTEADFIQSFAGIYESSPWVAARSHPRLPFATPANLRSAFRQAVDQASPDEQDTLIRAHPDLAGKLARSGQLTTDSTREQSRLNLNQLDDASYALFDSLNQQYQQRFAFPFIICVGLLQDRSEVLAAFHSRLTHSPARERLEALRQIHLIAALRLSHLVEDLPVP
jgi:OHCU decarboxylase